MSNTNKPMEVKNNKAAGQEVLKGTAINDHPALPAMKWVGGKRQLLSTFEKKIPEKYGRYIDPFMGALALPLHLQPNNALLSDANKEIVITHKAIRDDVERVISTLEKHKDNKDYYNKIRARDWKKMPAHAVAARALYLNKTSFNGLYRLNQKGGFSASYGKPTSKGRTICDPTRLHNLSVSLKDFEIEHQDFREALKQAKRNDLVFLDPPYHDTFNSYTAARFSEEDQKSLAVEFRRLDQLGCHIIACNSNHAFIRELYSDYSIEVVDVRRNINCQANGRTGKEVIITNRKRVAANEEVVLDAAA